MTTYGLIRHGVTDWNQQGRMQGKNDISLNAEGRRQAELLGKRLRGESWDYIYSSNMKRARETADIIAEHLNMKVAGYEVLLQERWFGRLDGTTEEERIERWGEGWRELDHGGEARQDVYQRGLDVLDRLHAAHPGKRILIISHGAVIGSLVETLFPDFGYMGLKNTCVNIITRTDEGWQCSLHNCVSHLEASG